MKNAIRLLVYVLYLIVSVSCSTDSPSEKQAPVNNSDNTGKNANTGGSVPTDVNENLTNQFFGFLDSYSISGPYIDMPVESLSTNLIVGRWKIIKIGIDENNDGNIKYYNYLDYKHNECGLSFLQFNSDGIVFENSYYNDNGKCILYTGKENWRLPGNDRITVGVYNNINIIKVTQSEMVLNYDWNNVAWGPQQVYYHYERILLP